MIKTFYLRGLLIISFFLVSKLLIAQGDPADGEDPEGIPLDPGSWVLVAAGVGYGIKKWRDVKMENKKNREHNTTDFSPDGKPGNDTNSIM
ncbi:MAG: hypothetical protein ABJB86_12765 [Bacteroidota bacterium]